jgi:asparagine synthase (glutamine-hydrolysing)
MCGIAGWIGNSLPATAREQVRAMTDAMARRGPDSEGLESWPQAVLGHRRLSIFDLSPLGKQPMLTPDGELGIVFNGAIYNFLDLRAELQQAGYRFASQCDTEVLLYGYRHWGFRELIRRCRGMFAIGLWDQREQVFYLVRDRLGVKPLLYARRGDTLAFASTAEALRAGGFAGDLNEEAVLEFLEFGFVSDQRVIYEGLHKVAAGTILEFRRGQLTESSYWDLPRPEAGLKISFNEAVEETERLLLEAVQLRLEADVPVGALLSAGIDSSLVCWAMAQRNARITAYTVSTPGNAADESAEAAATAQRLGIPHEIVSLSGSEPPGLDALTTAFGEPFGCSSALAMLRVSQAVKSRATVLLTGDGGDDVFLGYPFHKHFLMAQRVARSTPAILAEAWPAVRGLMGAGALRRPKHFLDYAMGGVGAVTRVHDGLPYYERLGLLGPRLAGRTIRHRQIPLSLESGRNLVSDFLQYEHRNRFPGEFMTKVDGGTMHYAIEARSPLQDQVLWEFGSRLPVELRLEGGELKAILREITRRRLGEEVANRPKRGFTVPVNDWLGGDWGPGLKGLGKGSRLDRLGWIDGKRMAGALEEARARRRGANQLYYLYVLEHWLAAKGF